MHDIRRDLLAAYTGTYEDSLKPDYERYVQNEGQDGAVAVEAFESWLESVCAQMIRDNSPKTRLEVYLEWNGIIGYTESIFAIANGGYKNA